MTTAAKTYRASDLERAICARSFPDFLERVRIQEPATPADPSSGGILAFQRWPHLLELADALVKSRLLAVVKARQLGVTWTVAAYLSWLANYRQGVDALLLSRTEIDAADFLGRVATVQKLLPVHLASAIAHDSSLSLALRNGARLMAMASTEDAGRGHAYSIVAQDEADFHPYLAENFAAAKPTIDAGGQMVQVSTVNKRKLDSLFKGIIRGAPGNGWRKLFFPWDVRPGRDQAWYDCTKAATPPSLGMSPELYMEQEYPSSEAEALAASRAVAFFSTEALSAFLADCREPEMRQGGLIRIWRPPVVGGKYVGFGDVAWGHASAYSCFTLADWQTGEQVAEVYGRPEHDEYAKAIADETAQYNKAYFGIEANGEGGERSGLNVVNKLIALGLGRQMYHHGEAWEQNEGHRGYLTTATTRPVMLGELEEAVRLRGIVPHCRDAVSEMLSFIRNEKGRPEATPGAKADHVMSWAGLWQMRKYARYGVGGTKGWASGSVLGAGAGHETRGATYG